MSRSSKDVGLRVFVTGVSSGIGRQLAVDLVAAGYEVFGIARREKELRELAEQIANSRFTHSVCDVSDPDSRSAISRELVAKQWLPDVVILNAGIEIEEELPGLSVEVFERTMRTNCAGSLFWISEFIEPFQARGSGQFIAVSSTTAHWPKQSSVAYSASKAALSMIMRALRARYAGSGLLFKLLYLGPVATGLHPRFLDQSSSGSPLIASAKNVSVYLVKMIRSKREDHYFPALVWLVCTFLRWLPDKVFIALSLGLRR